jgi:ERCC4-type nuclease
MITVDDRTGSHELYPLLLRRGLPAKLGRMAFGDISFMGNGPDGTPVSVGVEYKHIRDVLKCITDGRFAGHQLPGLIQCYNLVYLMVEGEWRARQTDGILEVKSNHGFWYEGTVGQRRFMYKDLVTWISTIMIKGGVTVVRVYDLADAIMWLSAMYRWWEKGWDSHESHLALNTANDISNDPRFRDRALLTRPTLLRMFAAQLPGVGFDKSKEIAKFFGSPENLFAASMWDLQQVPGIGKQLAERIYAALRSDK